MKDLIGHEKQIKKLENIIDNNTISNAYIFYGIKGIGKATIAKKFAEKVVGKGGYILVEPQENTIKVDTIRELKDEAILKPIGSERKIIIIDDAECMNEQAQNALLKILEEPPTYLTMILITSNKEKLLYTIKSRCVEFKFDPLNSKEIEIYFGKELPNELIEFSRGSIGEIKNIIDSGSIDIVERWINAFKSSSLIETMKEINEIKEEKFVKENLQDFLKNLLFYYYKGMKIGKLENVEAINIIENTKNNISKNANVDIAIDRMVIKLWKWRIECKKL